MELAHSEGSNPSGSTGDQHFVDRQKFGALAQLGERLPCTQEVTGSNPVGSTLWVPQPVLEKAGRLSGNAGFDSRGIHAGRGSNGEPAQSHQLRPTPRRPPPALKLRCTAAKQEGAPGSMPGTGTSRTEAWAIWRPFGRLPNVSGFESRRLRHHRRVRPRPGTKSPSRGADSFRGDDIPS